MSFKKRDKVVLKEDIDGEGIFERIHAGTKGIITTPTGVISGPKIAFEGHRGEHTVSERKIMKI